jgi:hypothetical protein
MKRPLNIVAAIGLALGAVLGMAGTFVADPNLRSILWGIDSLGVIVATTVLALKFFRSGNDAVAAGFLIYTIGECVMLGGTAQSLDAMVPAFAAGAALWAVGLLLTAIPRGFSLWIRFVSIIAALLFAATAARIFAGTRILATDRPLPTVGYPFLVLSFAGWIWFLLQEA